MATRKKKIETKKEKKRLIVSYEKLPEADKQAFEDKYGEDGYVDYVQSVSRPNGEPLFVVPLETEENIYMVKVQVVVDDKIPNDDILPDEKTNRDADDESMSEDNERGRDNSNFKLNHGDYSGSNFEEQTDKDINEDNFTSIDDIDIADGDPNIGM